MKKYETFLNKAFNKMFIAVGFNGYDKTFTEQEDWYHKKTWTQKQSDEFKTWFVSEAKKDLKFTKTMAEKEHAWFDLKWGWKVNQ